MNGTFRDPSSDALQRLTNIGTVIGDKVYSIIYYSPAETYPVYNTIYGRMINSFEVIPQSSSTVNPEVSTYQNTDYGIQIKYPSGWSKQESTASGTPINVVTFVLFLQLDRIPIRPLTYPYTWINFTIRLLL